MNDRLHDEAAIRRLFDRYGAAVDERDWKDFLDLFTDPLEIDFSGLDPSLAPATVPRADHVAGAAAVIGQFETTQHMITNVIITLAGDRATARAVVRAEHWLAGWRGTPRYTLFGVYENAFTRTASGWRISRLALRKTREEGNADVWAEAVRRATRSG